ncbi:hypothetical protein D9981_19955 [Pseudoalteromonas phenolica O-BC30]|nr:hypothetical protein [Pseudoalteromonas phenolica O-BC30]RXE93997.1 hypothetical protein D9981_19955 [Pseudoalteromonas phenolica O-BC30]
MIGFHTALSIFDLEPLDLQIDALSDSQSILAEPRILRWFGYKNNSNKKGFTSEAFFNFELKIVLLLNYL